MIHPRLLLFTAALSSMLQKSIKCNFYKGDGESDEKLLGALRPMPQIFDRFSEDFTEGILLRG